MKLEEFKHPSVVPEIPKSHQTLQEFASVKPLHEEWVSTKGDVEITTRLTARTDQVPYSLDFTVRVGRSEKSVNFNCSREKMPNQWDVILLCTRIHNTMLLAGETEFVDPESEEERNGLRATGILARGIELFFEVEAG